MLSVRSPAPGQTLCVIPQAWPQMTTRCCLASLMGAAAFPMHLVHSFLEGLTEDDSALQPQTSIVRMKRVSAFLTQTPPSGDSLLEAMAEDFPGTSTKTSLSRALTKVLFSL